MLNGPREKERDEMGALLPQCTGREQGGVGRKRKGWQGKKRIAEPLRGSAGRTHPRNEGLGILVKKNPPSSCGLPVKMSF